MNLSRIWSRTLYQKYAQGWFFWRLRILKTTCGLFDYFFVDLSIWSVQFELNWKKLNHESNCLLYFRIIWALSNILRYTEFFRKKTIDISLWIFHDPGNFLQLLIRIFTALNIRIIVSYNAQISANTRKSGVLNSPFIKEGYKLYQLQATTNRRTVKIKNVNNNVYLEHSPFCNFLLPIVILAMLLVHWNQSDAQTHDFLRRFEHVIDVSTFEILYRTLMKVIFKRN